MPVRFPEMRVNLKEGLRVLASGGSPRPGGSRAVWPGLTEGVNWLDDNAPAPASEWIGATLRDAEEARLVQRVHDAWDAVLSECAAAGGAAASDDVHAAAPSWPTVGDAASAALERLEAADR